MSNLEIASVLLAAKGGSNKIFYAFKTPTGTVTMTLSAIYTDPSTVETDICSPA